MKIGRCDRRIDFRCIDVNYFSSEGTKNKKKNNNKSFQLLPGGWRRFYRNGPVKQLQYQLGKEIRHLDKGQHLTLQ